MSVQNLRSIYQLKITLKYIRPPIWRRLQIASTVNLSVLHGAIQIAMGWSDSHLHEFMRGRVHYGIPDNEFQESRVLLESKFRLGEILKKEKDAMLYMYDFGDGWEHQIMLEKILPYKDDSQLPACITGRRASPPEDVGGPPGYAIFLEALADPANPEHESYLEWMGDAFDPEHFDIDEVNGLLQKYRR